MLTRRILFFALSPLVLSLALACAGTTASPSTAGKPGEAKPEPGEAKPPAKEASVAGDVARGRQLFVQQGCVACHTVSSIPEAKGNVGPALDGVASRPQIAGVIPNDTANLKRWLANPPGVKPGTVMPNLNLQPAQIDDLTAFLQTLR